METLSYKLLSLDARQARGEGTITYWLFNGSVPRLVERLAVPVLPAPLLVDRTTDWKSVLLREFDSTSAYPYTITSRPEKRRKHSNGGASDHKRQKFLKESGAVSTPCRNLLRLPAELIGMIFDKLWITDALRLTLVSQRSWDIGWTYVEKKLMGFMAPWAGHRLICLYEDPKIVRKNAVYPESEYPPGMLSIDEEEELSLGLTSEDHDDDGASMEAYTGIRVDLAIIALWRYEHNEIDLDDVPPISLTSLLRDITENQMHDLPQSLRSKVLNFSHFHLPNYLPNDRKWVLRNLTTHEFVRSEALAIKNDQHGPYFEHLGFEHIVLSRIFWSPILQHANINGRVERRGVWAGHRFEITTLDRHTASMQPDVAWTDISNNAADDWMQHWRTVFCSET
ncbi:hypothetical protein MMC07_006015 [Pseudocyphellaria aurata]|nr:hypothetical protein [Pseudocyphellaria aurata]